MPFAAAPRPELGLLETTLSGRVTDDELLDYYARALAGRLLAFGRELVDAIAVTDLAITPKGHDRLAVLLRGHVNDLRGLRVAMVAGDDYAFGMFRMWELQREDLGYEVRVFRSREEACAWLGVAEPAARNGAGSTGSPNASIAAPTVNSDPVTKTHPRG
jgi:hypothetical protein